MSAQVAERPATTQPVHRDVEGRARCARARYHRPHTWVTDPASDVEWACPGGPGAEPLAGLLGRRPELAGVGVAGSTWALEVMST